MKVDERKFHIGLEFINTGFVQKFVLRFCGEKVGVFDTLQDAQSGQLATINSITSDLNPNSKLNVQNTNSHVVASEGSVCWLLSGLKMRVTYGADVKDFNSNEKVEAAEAYGLALLHQLQCMGLI